jgi:hypothetical protein
MFGIVSLSIEPYNSLGGNAKSLAEIVRPLPAVFNFENALIFRGRTGKDN